METEQLFVRDLLEWDQKDNRRQMPWKGEKDPYKIWLSEIILQQTRVEQGLKYYENFIEAFPNLQALAVAPEERVFKFWEGLGYYSRCRNLISAARFIANDLGGIFPVDYESLLRLKGVGSYTAAAIASFAYNLPHAVLDGNVFRVLSRVFEIELAIDSVEGKKRFSQLAQNLLPQGKAAIYNQAIMDFGALVCKPQPLCGSCFFKKNCRSFLKSRQEELPVKEKKLKIKERWFSYFILSCKGHIAIRQRIAKDIWQQLFEFPLIEMDSAASIKSGLRQFEKKYEISEYKLINSFQGQQRLTHQLIHFQFSLLELNLKEELAEFKWITIGDLDHYAFPKTLQELIFTRLKEC